MQSVGICGSDIHFYTHGKVGDYVMEQPMVMGHEASGVVVATGHGVTNVKVGKLLVVCTLYALKSAYDFPCLPSLLSTPGLNNSNDDLLSSAVHNHICCSTGDRVAVEPGIPCRVCALCKRGRYNLCPGVKFGSCPPEDGFLCRYTTHAADFCYV